MFLSGAAGVGKTTLMRQRLRQIKDLVDLLDQTELRDSRAIARRSCSRRSAPAPSKARPRELRRILEVFLRHQAGNGRSAFDRGATASSASRRPCLRELEALAQVRLRNRPVVYFLVLTRSEELVANLLPQYDGGPLARAAHQRLAGFTLDETRSYIWACLRGAGCDWAEELVPEEVALDIQAFTQGIVGDVNATLLRGARCDRGTLDGQQSAAEDHAGRAEGSRRQA